ncbi:ribosomal protein S18-alanine N-acetyltransferase [Corynebacterium mendelii]|uniref:[Ribosomal protein bS18]-alanine N-acetyltransferase n=1 Tax=Corynebacterium mendelii TaxID=2765362 RepID=A0A939DZD0_9CORY|nr:ribosomal protein S18-alanine N-acetyltransferase [Corynebacterium mendelii]MBN9644049.1 ribosomal protein S18-alanine N-acetyltransferase [Corynebacterium mendelii]
MEQVLFAGDSPWTARMFHRELASPVSAYFGCDCDGMLVAYLGIGIRGPRNDPEFEILTIGCDPAYQRRGLARRLMGHAVHIAEKAHGPVYLEVRCDNDPAIALYRSFGFTIAGVRKNYYQPSGADAFTMVRPAV